MTLSHIVLAVFWIVYCALHSVLADSGIKKTMSRLMGNRFRYYRIFYTLFALAGLVGIIWYLIRMESPLLFEIKGWVIVAGIMFSFSGLVLMLVCIRKYFFSLSGLKSLFYEGPSQQLIISGVHKYVRHPLYLGTFAFIWGLLLLLPYLSFLITNIVITVYTLVGIRLEESKLLEEYGESYAHYRRHVRQLLPFPKKSIPDAGKQAFTD